MENSDNVNMDLKNKIDLEEFKAMHAQIISRADIQKSILAMNNTLIVAVLTIVFAYLIPLTIDNKLNFIDGKLELLNYFLLLITIPFYLFIESYLHSNYMIAKTAGFIHHVLRKQLISSAGTQSILLNEEWFKEVRQSNKGFKFFFRAPFVMLVVPISMIIMYLSFNFYGFLDRVNQLGLYLEFGILILNVILIVLLIKRIRQGDLELINIAKEEGENPELNEEKVQAKEEKLGDDMKIKNTQDSNIC